MAVNGATFASAIVMPVTILRPNRTTKPTKAPRPLHDCASTISIAAYQKAFEQYDMSAASAIAVVMGLCQLAALLVIIMFRRRLSPAAWCT